MKTHRSKTRCRSLGLSPVILAVVLLVAAIAQASECPLPTPDVLKRQPGGATVLWRLKNSKSLREAYQGSDAALASYRAWVRSKTSLSTRALIVNHRGVIERAASQSRQDERFARSLRKDVRNVDLVLSGGLGVFRPMSCLESLPFRQFLRVVDLRRETLEFSAVVLVKESDLIVIADLYRQADSSATESLKALSVRRSLQSQGWTLHAHLHNHPFNFENSYGDLGGVVVPSSADLGVYRDQRPAFAWITNGLGSLSLSSKDVSRFER